jgi:hypothetical protein
MKMPCGIFMTYACDTFSSSEVLMKPASSRFQIRIFCSVTGLLAVPYRKFLLANVFTGTFYCKTRAKFSSTLG